MLISQSFIIHLSLILYFPFISQVLPSSQFQNLNTCIGVTVSSSLSWSKHISLVCSKSRCLLGLLYCQFYHHSNPQTLLQLHTSLIHLHLDYYSSIWDSHSIPHLSASIQRVQFFACKLCSKNWSASYHSFLSTFKFPTLSSCR